MNLPLLLLAGLLGFFAWRAWRRLPFYERSLATRGGMALLLINLFLAAGLAFLPGRFKLFAILPALLSVGSTIKVLRGARQRFRERLSEEARFAQAKRVN
jgi:hypothetical protein